MKKKLISLVLVALMLLVCSGCSTVSDIAGNVAKAAMEELENQVKLTLEKYKVDVIEVKTAAGKLNGDAELQFYCAALVRSDSDALPNACAEGLKQVFPEAGVAPQTGSAIESPHLVHKTLSFDHTDFSAGGYYIIYVYTGDMNIQLPDFTIPTKES